MNEPFTCEMLCSRIENRELIKEFTIDREKEYSNIPNKVVGLEAYLKICAWEDDQNDLVRVYLIKDSVTGDIVSYFAIKSGMIAAGMDEAVSIEKQRMIFKEEGVKIFPEVLPGIEISHFAINDEYRRKISESDKLIKGLGKYLYPKYIYPIIFDVGCKIGVHMVYLYAAGGESLVNYYRNSFGFNVLTDTDPYAPLEPEYDGGCTFMYQRFYSHQ